MSDILFIHPANHRKTYQELANEFTAVAPPLWACLVCDYLRREGISVAIHDTNVQGWSPQHAQQVLSRHNPELVVMLVYGHNPSASVQTMAPASAIAKDIKRANRDLPIAFGGLHPTALPTRTLNEENIDYVVKGDGAATILKLFNCLRGKLAEDQLTGICMRRNGEAVDCGRIPVTKDLDGVFSEYAWDLLPPLKMYRAHNSHCFQYFEESETADFSDVRSPYAVIYTSLGCPYKCSYCCINALYGKPGLRSWSMETVMRWIDNLVDVHHVKHLRLDDELFVFSKKRTEDFCDRLIERGHDLNLWAYARCDTIDPRLLGKMKRAGLNWLCLGIESGNHEVRSDIGKNIRGNINETVRMIQDCGIHVLGNYMFGLPHDTLETMRQTLRMAMEQNCEFVNFYSTMAYPGSALYDEWMRKDPSALPETWDGFSQHSYQCRPLPTEHLTAAEVLEFRDRAFRAYFENPRYLTMVQSRFGKRTLDHIVKMTQINLPRKICPSLPRPDIRPGKDMP